MASARFTMKATVLKRGYQGEIEDDRTGNYVVYQDPDSGAVTRRWEEVPKINVPSTLLDIDCVATAYTGTAGRNINNVMSFVKEDIHISEFVSISYPPKYQLSVLDRITNIRDYRGNIIWNEAEYGNFEDADAKIAKSTVFNITGITPVTDFQGRIVEYYAVLRRAQDQ